MSLGPNRTGFEDVGDERWKVILASNETGDERIRRLELPHKPQVFLEGSGSFVREGDDPRPLSPFDGDPETLYQGFLPDAIIHRTGHLIVASAPSGCQSSTEFHSKGILCKEED